MGRRPFQSARFCFEVRKAASLMDPVQPIALLAVSDGRLAGGPQVDPRKFATFFVRQLPILALAGKPRENAV